MKRHTQEILYHLLPADYWLLAIGGVVVWDIFSPYPFHLSRYIPAVLALLSVWLISRIRKHSSSEEECFEVAVILGYASYWLPSVLFLIVPIWGYLIYQNLFSLRSFAATLVGLALVAVWAAVFIWLDWIANPWVAFFAEENVLGWIPTGAMLIAWLATVITHNILRIR